MSHPNTINLNFTKMHGAGNDFVVLNAMQGLPYLQTEHFQYLADRRYGVGCDQILIIAPPINLANDFSYRIINSDGSEVEQCGNGARCFMRFIRDQGLTTKTTVRVEVATGVIVLTELDDGKIQVNMGAPRFEPETLPFNLIDSSQQIQHSNGFKEYQLATSINYEPIRFGIVSMGNPHAVIVVDDVQSANVVTDGKLIENHPAFPKRVNVGFMQVVDIHTIKLRVWERGAGETLACGTGACAAAVVGIQKGLLQSPVTVEAKGGRLNIEWNGMPNDIVMMSGEAVSVFTGTISLP